MKAQRRHELRTNQLARSLETFPDKLRRHANKIFLGFMALILIVLLVRYRINSAADQRQKVTDALAEAQGLVSDMRTLPPIPEERKGIFDAIRGNLDIVDQGSADQGASVQAGALAARGDADFEMASAELTVSTRPSDPDLSPSDLLKAAEDAYTQVVNQYPTESLAVADAHFGLAAIDENRHEWDKAHIEYQAVASQVTLADSIKAYAQERDQMLAGMRLPIYVAPPLPASEPSTGPTANIVPAVPATQPTTR